VIADGPLGRAWRSLATTGFATVFLTGGLACQTLVPRDAGSPIDPDDAEVRGLLRDLRETSAQRSTLRGRATLSLDSPQLRFSRPQRLVLSKPASLRIEVLGLFDQVAAVVATDGETFGFVDMLSRTRDSGPVDDEVLWRTARVDLTPAEAVSLLLGAPALDPAADTRSAVRFADGGVGALIEGPEAAHWLEWDAGGALRRVERRELDGGVRWNARYADRREVSGVSFAHAVELEFARVDALARLQYESVELQPELSASLFVLQVAPGE